MLRSHTQINFNEQIFYKCCLLCGSIKCIPGFLLESCMLLQISFCVKEHARGGLVMGRQVRLQGIRDFFTSLYKITII